MIIIRNLFNSNNWFIFPSNYALAEISISFLFINQIAKRNTSFLLE